MPNFELPEPLRGCEPGSFAESTVRVRLRDIGLRTLRENAFSEPVTARLMALISDLPDGRIRPLLEAKAPDLEDWQGYVKPYLGQSWLEVPWFFAETYFYRRLLEATGYYSEDSLGIDPYRLQKRLGLEQNLAKIREACDFTEHLSARFRDGPLAACTLLSELMLLSLWGNQADLSIWSVGLGDMPDERSAIGLTSLTSNLLGMISRKQARTCASCTGPGLI